MFELIFIIAMAGYALQSILFYFGIKRQYPRLPADQLPSASVIVAARNEEAVIERCLLALDNLQYPDGKLEIILVDDHSTDATGSIMDRFIAGKPRFKKIASAREIGHLKGKTNALANGIEVASGGIILTTDADCAPSPDWALTIASYYTQDVAIVNGFTSQEGEGSFAGMQNLDFLYLLSVAAATINLRLPTSCIGNNMSFLRKAYLEVGGYQNLPFSVTEDFNLLMAINRLKKYKIIYPLDSGAHVVSLPCANATQLYRQKKRWAVGGLKAPLRGFIIVGNGWIAHLLTLMAPFFFSPLVLALIGAKLLLDFFLLSHVTSRLRLLPALRHFIAFELYYILYVLALPVPVLFSRKVVWKERKF